MTTLVESYCRESAPKHFSITYDCYPPLSLSHLCNFHDCYARNRMQYNRGMITHEKDRTGIY